MNDNNANSHESSSKKEKKYKTKQEELSNMTKELKSHYFMGKYFVDPDKNFISLLDKIINFFENDELLDEIKDNEHLYLSFKSKYEEAIECIKILGEEKEKLEIALRNSMKQSSYLQEDPEREKSIIEDEDSNQLSNSPYDKFISTPVNKSSLSKRKNQNLIESESKIISEFDMVCNNNEQNRDALELEKIKEEFIVLLREKSELENELVNYYEMKKKYEKMKFDYEDVKELNERQAEVLNIKEKNEIAFRTQIDNLNQQKENVEKDFLMLRETFRISEIEKNEIKIKNAHHLSKFKNMEKEINLLRKKNASSNNNIKSLLEKIRILNEENQHQKETFNRRIEEFENKIEQLKSEKKNLTRDALTTFIENSMKKNSSVTFSFNPHTNKIEIKYQNEKIGEVTNSNDAVNDKENLNTLNNNPLTDNNNNNNIKKGILSPFNISKESSVFHYRQLTIKTSNLINSHGKTINCNECFESPNQNITLKKIFSNSNFSMSSKKSFGSVEKENKENININLNSINLNPNSFAESLRSERKQSIGKKPLNKEKSLNQCINLTSITIGKEKEKKPIVLDIAPNTCNVKFIGEPYHFKVFEEDKFTINIKCEKKIKTKLLIQENLYNEMVEEDEIVKKSQMAPLNQSTKIDPMIIKEGKQGNCLRCIIF